MESKYFDLAYRTSIGSVPFDPNWNIDIGNTAGLEDIGVLPGEIINSYNENSHERVLFLNTRYGNIGLIELFDQRGMVFYQGAFPEKFQEDIDHVVIARRLDETDIKSIIDAAMKQVCKHNLQLTQHSLLTPCFSGSCLIN